jgi:hypothetical protein
MAELSIFLKKKQGPRSEHLEEGEDTKKSNEKCAGKTRALST